MYVAIASLVVASIVVASIIVGILLRFRLAGFHLDPRSTEALWWWVGLVLVPSASIIAFFAWRVSLKCRKSSHFPLTEIEESQYAKEHTLDVFVESESIPTKLVQRIFQARHNIVKQRLADLQVQLKSRGQILSSEQMNVFARITANSSEQHAQMVLSVKNLMASMIAEMKVAPLDLPAIPEVGRVIGQVATDNGTVVWTPDKKQLSKLQTQVLLPSQETLYVHFTAQARGITIEAVSGSVADYNADALLCPVLESRQFSIIGASNFVTNHAGLTCERVVAGSASVLQPTKPTKFKAIIVFGFTPRDAKFVQFKAALSSALLRANERRCRVVSLLLLPYDQTGWKPLAAHTLLITELLDALNSLHDRTTCTLQRIGIVTTDPEDVTHVKNVMQGLCRKGSSTNRVPQWQCRAGSAGTRLGDPDEAATVDIAVWKNFNQSENEAIENLCGLQTTLKLASGVIDIKLLTHTNSRNVQRRVRRVMVFPLTDSPSSTQEMNQDAARQHKYSTAQSEMLWIAGFKQDVQHVVGIIRMEVNKHKRLYSVDLPEGNFDTLWELCKPILAEFSADLLFDVNQVTRDPNARKLSFSVFDCEKLALLDTKLKLQLATQQHVRQNVLIQYPKTWTPMQNVAQERTHFELIDVQRSSDEWNEVVTSSRFHETMPNSTVKHIYRVQNPFLWSQYVNYKPNVHVDNEMRLWHGTKELQSVCQSGIDFRLAKAGLWGRGAYFAFNAAYSHRYACPVNSDYYLFVCKVRVGKSFDSPQSEETLVMPPKGHDSVKGFARNSDIFVVYSLSQVYPEYLVRYSE